MTSGALPYSGTTFAGIADSASLTVYQLFRSRATSAPQKNAIQCGGCDTSYGELLHRVDQLAAALQADGVEQGDRIAVFAENRREYIEIHLAAASLGAIVACQNWRLNTSELQHCVSLVEPAYVIFSERYAETVAQLKLGHLPQLQMGTEYEARLVGDTEHRTPPSVNTEAGLLILYTSGTTGPAKAALISHRALVARMTVLALDLGINRDDGFLAWSPMFHIGGTEHSLSTLMMGGTVYITDGFDPDAMAEVISNHRLGWLLLVPAMAERLQAAVAKQGGRVKGVKAVGSMPDMVPKASIAELSTFFNAPFFNTFGATETGLPPASGALIPIGCVPTTLSKKLSSMCAMRVVDDQDRDVSFNSVGEVIVRGPTLFSGYWGADAINEREFRDGWFHMGDLFRRNEDGSFDFAGRSKYLIKSGGENIYPAEIEHLLLSDPAVSDAVVVRKQSDQWGEIPVAFVARNSEALDAEQLLTLCRENLARYKHPKEFHFVDFEAFPRNSNGKIIREQVEDWL